MYRDFYKYLPTLTPLRQKQLKTALFVNLVDKPEELTTFSKYEREQLAAEFDFTPFKVKSEQVSKDGSTKWAFELSDGNIIETVLLQFRDGRNTVCVSSQAGCPCGCRFCATGQMGFKRNLTAWEIIAQTLFAARYLRKTVISSALSLSNGQSRDLQINQKISPTSARGRDDKNASNLAIQQCSNDHITNVVLMGMGEPLLNLENVLFVIRELNNPDYFNLGRRHITLSTCGIIRELGKFIEADTGVTLAISLHAPTQQLRESLMPIAKVSPLPDLFKTLDQFVEKTNKKITYEYLMLAGVNDSVEQAKELGKLLKGRLALLNLIPYNSVPGINFQPSSKIRVEKFKNEVGKFGVPVTVRVSLGDEIAAACGQLAAKPQGMSK